MKSFASFKSEGKDCRVRGDCIGPEVGGSLTVSERLVMPLVIGFGCLHYTDNYNKLSIGDFGVHLDIGRESRTPPAPGRAPTAACGFISKKISENSKIC